MKHALKALFSVAVLGLTAVAAADTVTTTLTNDSWYYPFNGTPGTKNSGAIFDSDFAQYGFNHRDGQAVIQFNTTLPGTITGGYTVTSARLEVWNPAGATWDPTTTTLELYSAGFGSTYKETAADAGAAAVWTETSTFVGGGAAPNSRVPRDPYPRDYTTNQHVEDNLTTATPWSFGTHPEYTSTGNTADAFKITFTLPVGELTTQQELKNDLQRGVSTWIVSTNFLAAGIGAAGSPAVYLNGASAVPAPASVPKLFIEVSSQSSVRDWQLYY